MKYILIITSLAVLTFSSNYNEVQSLSFGSIFNKTKEITNLTIESGVAIGKSIPEYIPSGDELLDLSKQAFAGLPFEAASSVINKICKVPRFNVFEIGTGTSQKSDQGDYITLIWDKKQNYSIDFQD